MGRTEREGGMRRAEQEGRGGGGLCRGGRAESEPWGAGRGRERTPGRGESRGGVSMEINRVSEKSGFRRVSLFVIIIRITLSLRSLGRVGGRNGELEWEKLGV